MSGARNPWTQFFAELKRRRVFRVAGAYLAAAFVVLQFADYLFRGLALPDWAFRLIVVVVVLGFLVAVPLAWAYDVGPGGIQRTPAVDQLAAGEAERRAGVRWWPVVATLALLAVAGGGWLALRGRQPAGNPRRVVVVAFDNQTGEAALAPLSSMAADWITQGLTETGIVEVADAPTALTVAREARTASALTGADAVRLYSRETGASLVITGRYYRQADSLEFVAQVVDARTGKVVRAVGPVTAPAALPVQGAETLRQRLMATLAVLLDDRLAPFQALERQPPSYQAYREYIDGLDRYLARDPRAVDHFERAFALDSTFDRALLWAAECLLVVPFETPLLRYDTLLARVERRRSRLSAAEQYQLDFVRALRAGDVRAAYVAARQRWEAAPGSDDALRELMSMAFRVSHFREANELYDRIDWNRGLLRRFSTAPAYIASVQHGRGDFQGELRTATEWARRAPDSYDAGLLTVRALAALGRTEEVRALASHLADRLAHDARIGGREEPLASEVVPFQVGARVLNKQGKLLEARAVAWDGVSRCKGLAPTPAQLGPASRLSCADLMGFIGRWHDADSLLRGMNPPEVLLASYLTQAGMAAARVGDRARALALSDSLARQPLRTSGDMWERMRIEYLRAMIAAALGDREDALRRLRLFLAKGNWAEPLSSEPIFMPYFTDPHDPRFRKLLESED